MNLEAEAASQPFIELDRFLKFCQVVPSGGEAKHLIRSGDVMVNGAIEMRRGRKLRHGDEVEVGGEILIVEINADPDEDSGGA